VLDFQQFTGKKLRRVYNFLTYCNDNTIKLCVCNIGFTELFFSSPRTKLDLVETPRLVDTWQTGQPLDVVETATATAQQLRRRHSIRLRISALSTSDVEGVVQDLDTLCTDVVQKHTIDANEYGETISGLTDVQVLSSFR